MRLQAQDRLRVELRDAGLGDAEHLADLAERELLVVVERDDELLALGKVRDRLGERLLHLASARAASRVGAGLVLDRVDEGDRVPAADGDQSSSSAPTEEREISRQAVVELLLGDAELLRDLLVRRRAVELLLERRDRTLDLARAVRTERGTQSSERARR
jgi:hypothetical protein